jgi:hypothetical protein
VDAGSNRSFKQQLREYLAARQPPAIKEAVWRDLLERLAPVSESYLRQLLWATGLPFDQLEESLLGMGRTYADAMDAGDRERARYCRRQVIAAKDRAKFAAASPRTSPEKKAEKQEMAQWMLVWLGDPALFPAWLQARKRVLSLL